jgi:hypothetical protein
MMHPLLCRGDEFYTEAGYAIAAKMIQFSSTHRSSSSSRPHVRWLVSYNTVLSLANL